MSESVTDPLRADSDLEQSTGRLWLSGLWFALAIILVVSSFLYTTQRRRPFLEQAINAEYWTYQTAQTLCIARNWYEQSPWQHGFIMHSSPWSPAQSTIIQRSPYIRFPFGFAVPLYVSACLSNRPPDLRMLVQWNLAIQLATSLFCSLLAWKVLSVHRVPDWTRSLGAAFAGMTYVLSVVTLRGHAFDYHCTEAVLPWFVLTLLLEYWRLHVPVNGLTARLLRVALPIVVLIGCFMEWFMFIVVFVLLLRRWSMRGRECATATDNLILFLIPALVLALLLSQVATVGHFQILWNKFLQRSGLDPTLEDGANISMLKGFYHRALGLVNTFLVWGSLTALFAMRLFLRRRHDRIDRKNYSAFLDVAGLIDMTLIPCLLHAHILSEHYAHHEDDALKFIVGVALVPFILLPLAAALWLRVIQTEVRFVAADFSLDMSRDFRTATGAAVGLSILLGFGICLIPGHADWQGSFVEESRFISSIDLLIPKLLRDHTKPEDLCFSPCIQYTDDYEDLPKTGIARKVVFQLTGPNELASHPAVAAARSNGIKFRPLLIVSEIEGSGDVLKPFSEVLGRSVFESERFSIWELEFPGDPDMPLE